MIQGLGKFIIPILLIVAGVLLKKGLIPNTDNRGKLWLWLVVLGCLGILFNIVLLIIRNS
jgi:hypothetical protein